MKLGDAGHVLLAEARRSVWAVRPEFWDSFSRMLALDRLPVAVTEKLAAPEAAPPRRRTQERKAAVAVLPLHGLLTARLSLMSLLFGGSSIQGFRQSLREATRDDDVSAIVLDVDSPGGSSGLIEETAADIRAAREEKPVVASINIDAGSAAYWLASQADEIAITPSGMAGSIGAFILHIDFSGMNEKMGIDPTYISAGRFKVEGNEDEPLSDEATEHLQEIVDETYATFVRDVAAGRGVAEKTVRTGYGEGRMLTAPNALAAGMVDRIETIEETVAGVLEGGSEPRSSRKAAIPSGGGATLTEPDEAELEGSEDLRRSRKSRDEDEALADDAIASLTR